MQIFGQDPRFWLAVAAAVLFKVLTSEKTSPKRVVAIVIASVLIAWAFTDAVIHWLSLDPDTHKVPVAALLALSGENLARWISKAVPEDLVSLWKGIKK